jgi:hypothetical protein
MEKDRKGFWIVADILSQIGYVGNPFGDIESDFFHQDLANLMNYMIGQNMSFKKAVKAYRDENEENALWLEEILEKIGIVL